MKIGIVTIYKCYNFGSFYQAFGLQRYLQNLGHEVELLRLDNLYNRKYRLRKQFNRDLKRDIFSFKLINCYLYDWKLYHIAKAKSSNYDLIIIGSDEIWNINNKTFTPVPQYYGRELTCDRLVSYASCVGRCTADDFRNHTDMTEGIKKLGCVSARDDMTEKFLSALMPNRNVQRVLDPSFLIDWSIIEKKSVLRDFILVYTYDGSWGFSEECIKAAKEFSKECGLPLISVGFKNDWCDKSIACGPRGFLGYLRNATYVLSDTFHGTVMSIQYRKQFVCMGNGKSKVESLVKEFGLEKRVYKSEQCLKDIFSNHIDYDMIGKIQKEKLFHSVEYLHQCLK